MIDDNDVIDGVTKVIKCPKCSRSHVVHVALKDSTITIRNFYFPKLHKKDNKTRIYRFIKKILKYLLSLQRLKG